MIEEDECHLNMPFLRLEIAPRFSAKMASIEYKSKQSLDKVGIPAGLYTNSYGKSSPNGWMVKSMAGNFKLVAWKKKKIGIRKVNFYQVGQVIYKMDLPLQRIEVVTS